jgi:hypothetical protein
MKKTQRFATNDVVAIRNEDGGLWLGRLLRPLNLATEHSTKVQWFEEVSGKGKGKKYTLTPGKDDIATQSIHPMALHLVEEEGGLYGARLPRFVPACLFASLLLPSWCTFHPRLSQ